MKKLTLGLYGDAVLMDGSKKLWSSDTPEMQELFGDFIEEEQIGDIIDYLNESGLIADADPSAVEIIVEISDDEEEDELEGELDDGDEFDLGSFSED